MSNSNELSTLIIIISETRAHRLTGELFMKNVKGALNADLALCVRDDEEPNIFHENAEYIWKFKEPESYLEEFDKIAGHTDWHKAFEYGKSWLGAGNGASIPKQIGSCAIQYYYKWLLLKKLRENDLIKKYDWFILTRSDFMWHVPHCPTSLFDRELLYIPYGQCYDGVTDRHHIIPSVHIEKCLDLLEPILFDTDNVLKLFNTFYKEKEYVNSEMYIYIKYKFRIKYIPYIMYLVREKNGPTSWSTGDFNEELGYHIKYDSEYNTANEFLEIIKSSPSIEMFWKISLKKNMHILHTRNICMN